MAESFHRLSPEVPTLEVASPPEPKVEEERTSLMQEDVSLPPLKRKRQLDNLDSEDEKSKERQEEDVGGSGNGNSGETESKQQHENQYPLWKTSLCSYFRRSAASCSHGSTCRYAHGEAELRPRPDNTWDPTSEKGKSSDKRSLLIVNGLESDNSPLPVQDVLADSDGSEEELGLDKCISGIPMKWTSEKLKSFLDSEGIVCKSVRKRKGMAVGFLGFEDASQLTKAVEGLSGKVIGGKNLKISEVIHKSRVRKGTVKVPMDSEELENSISGDAHAGNSTSRARCARDNVVPLAHMPYEEQLEYKKNVLVQVLKRLTRHARKACPGSVALPEWIHKSREIGGLPCAFDGIVPSPTKHGYRNKCEFTVGYSLDGKKTVGFTLGNFREGMIAVEEPSDCSSVSEISCKYAKIFQDFLDSSTLPVWNRLNNTGFWRQLTVREGRCPTTDTYIDNANSQQTEVMLLIQVCSSDVDEELFNSELKKMSESFVLGASLCQPPLPLTALVIQDHKGISNPAPMDCPLFPLPIPNLENGNSIDLVSGTRIHDFLCNLKFCISPTAFFQVNTSAAEKLYSLAGDWANLKPTTLLFDICCGTGTIGLSLAHRVGMVVGIEMNQSAVEDAQRNADVNHITNCRFICAKAEDVMGTLLKEYVAAGQGNNRGMDNVADTPDEVVDATGPSESTSAVNGVKSLSGSENESGTLGMENHPVDRVNTRECGLGRCTTEPKEAGIIDDKKGKEEIALSLQQFEDVVVIVDPPRAGLHPIVIRALRTHPRLQRLVYISCNPDTLVANAIELCTPTTEDREKAKGNRHWRKMSNAGLARHRTKSMPHSEAFRPVRTVAVDMFPHTPHCEMVMLFER